MKTSNSNSPNNLKDRIGCFKTFWFIFLIGWLAIALLIYNAYKINETKTWLPTEAIVENVETETRRGHRRYSTFLILAYNYQVNGHKFYGKRLARSISNNQIRKIDWANGVYKKLDYAKKIEIYYNPENPKESVVINQFTNIWYFNVWLVLFINAIIYALKFTIERRNKLYVLMPIFIAIGWLCHYTTEIGYVDTSSMITVIEKYKSNDCKFAKRSFDESVYIQINNYRMEKNDIKFNRKSSIQKVNILESKDISDDRFQTIAEVVYAHDGEKTIMMKLEYEKLDVCWFSFQKIELLN